MFGRVGGKGGREGLWGNYGSRGLYENVAYDKGLTEMSLWDAICVSVFYSTETCVRLYHCDH